MGAGADATGAPSGAVLGDDAAGDPPHRPPPPEGARRGRHRRANYGRRDDPAAVRRGQRAGKLEVLSRILEVESHLGCAGLPFGPSPPREALAAAARRSRLSLQRVERRHGAGPAGAGRRGISREASSTFWSPPTWRPAASTWTASATSSTSTRRPTPRPTCTASGGRPRRALGRGDPLPRAAAAVPDQEHHPGDSPAHGIDGDPERRGGQPGPARAVQGTDHEDPRGRRARIYEEPIRDYIEEGDCSPERVAAALARLVQGDRPMLPHRGAPDAGFDLDRRASGDSSTRGGLVEGGSPGAVAEPGHGALPHRGRPPARRQARQHRRRHRQRGRPR